MQFIPLDNEEQLSQISSAKNTQVILKHNTTCGISKGVLERLQEEQGTIGGIDTIHVLDLLAHRDLSDAIAGRFGVPHQSPQILLIKDGRCTYHEWGFDISAEAMKKAVAGN